MMHPETSASLKLLWVIIQRRILRRPDSEIVLNVTPVEANFLYHVAVANGWRALAVAMLALRDSETGQTS